LTPARQPAWVSFFVSEERACSFSARIGAASSGFGRNASATPCRPAPAENGVSWHVVAERLGHSGITTLLRTYAHVLPGMQGAAADRMDARLHGAPAEAEAEEPGRLPAHQGLRAAAAGS